MEAYARLKSFLSELGGAAIGYSGGLDSTLLAKAAEDVLGDRAVCVLVESCLVPEADIEDAVALADELGLRLVRLKMDALAIAKVPDNRPDRCYHCKKFLFSEIRTIAERFGLAHVLDGSNADDDSDYRPGSAAIQELGVRSPLKELGITKEEARAISRGLGLRTWNKPSSACLASRVPYGMRLTEETLRRVELAEKALRELGFGQVRVRHYGDLARIEVVPQDVRKAMSNAARDRIVRCLRDLGYVYVALDLAGYRTGSMNEAIAGEGSGQ